VRNLGVNYGLVFTGFGVAGVVGPILGGRIRDAFGSYLHAFTISAVMLLFGALLAFFLRSPKSRVEPKKEITPAELVAR
jgi:OFA family oxalate/formate antiporter-like MFS transporter